MWKGNSWNWIKNNALPLKPHRNKYIILSPEDDYKNDYDVFFNRLCNTEEQ